MYALPIKHSPTSLAHVLQNQAFSSSPDFELQLSKQLVGTRFSRQQFCGFPVASNYRDSINSWHTNVYRYTYPHINNIIVSPLLQFSISVFHFSQTPNCTLCILFIMQNPAQTAGTPFSRQHCFKSVEGTLNKV